MIVGLERRAMKLDKCFEEDVRLTVMEIAL
jgi:hypothetical protein